jgi:membrane protein implicated in regulation of membrane protease activity
MFAGLPGRLSPPVLVAVLAITLVAGLLAGRVVGIRLARGSWRTVLLAAAAAGPVAGVLTALLVAAASGSVLGGGLAAVGASAWLTGLLVTVEIALAAVLGALTARAWRSRRRRRAVEDLSREASTGAHRRSDRRRQRRGWLKRPSWLRRPSWSRRPGWLHRPGWLRRRPAEIRLPD